MESNISVQPDHLDEFVVPFERLSPAQQVVRTERLREESKDRAAYEAAMRIAEDLTNESNMPPHDFMRSVMQHAQVTAETATAVLYELSSRQIITYTLGQGLSRGKALDK